MQHIQSNSRATLRPPMFNDESTQKWQKAAAKTSTVEAILNGPRPLAPSVADHARKLGVTTGTIYEWIRRYQKNSQSVPCMVDRTPGPEKGSVKFPQKQEAIIADAVKQLRKRGQKPKISKIADEVSVLCKQKNISPIPSYSTIRRRIKSLPPAMQTELLEGKTKAKNKHRRIKKQYQASHPLEIVQLDHTLVDEIVVDRMNRQPIGRPWLTLAIDIFSRSIVGYYISFEHPSSASVAVCIANAILPKRPILEQFELDEHFTWPCSGKMKFIHTDRAKEFKAAALKIGCLKHSIKLILRPPKTPHFGGHIERLIGTIMGGVHFLPGTTFSDTKAKNDYDSENNSFMSLPEFEKWIIIEIIKYNNKYHSIIQQSPISKFSNHEYTNKSDQFKKIYHESLYVDFLPIETRKARPRGIRFGHITYWAPFVRTPTYPIGKNVQFRYDRRDLSKIFYCASEDHYIEMPYLNVDNPKVTYWEAKAAREYLRRQGREDINEGLLFQAILRQRAIVEHSQNKTQKVRKNQLKAYETLDTVNRSQNDERTDSSSDTEEVLGELETYEIEEL